MSKSEPECYFEYNSEAKRYFSAKKDNNLFLSNGMISTAPGLMFLAGLTSPTHIDIASQHVKRFMRGMCELCNSCRPVYQDSATGILIERHGLHASSPEKNTPLYEVFSFVPTGHSRSTVCLIEDDLRIGKHLGKALSQQGYEVDFFWTIPQAREGGAECTPTQERTFVHDILQRNPDVVISDMTLGGIFNSFAVLETIKNTTDTTTVMLSGGVHNTAESRGAADHFLTKPISSRGLLDFLDAILVGE
jgi:CheY-like chemotaxis protein